MSGVSKKMKNKMLTVTLIVLVAITLISVIFLALYWQFNKDDDSQGNAPSIDQVIESSVDIPEIMTNLSGKQFIKVSLKIETDSKKAAEELQKREFQVKNIIIQELSEISAQDLEGKAGKQSFQETIKSLINPLMQEGEIKQVYFVSYIIQ